MPKLWNESIDAHREAVSEAIFAAAGAIISSEGFGALSMARIAQDAGIGRATLYKYFSDIDAVLKAWHEQAIAVHLELVEGVASSHDDPLDALTHVLIAYGNIRRGHGDHPGVAMLHGLAHVTHAHDHLRARLRSLIQNCVKSGKVRGDIPTDELAGFALAGMDNANSAKSERAVERTVDLILKGISA